jgi:hypothetical protein
MDPDDGRFAPQAVQGHLTFGAHSPESRNKDLDQ